MPAASPLFELIKSLTPSEKRHFRIFARRHVLHGENQYLRLFDLLDEQTDYDEAAVNHHLRTITATENTASIKHYLYQLILRSLRSYNSGRSAKIELKELLLDIDTLMEKGLLQQSMKLIRKAKKLALQYHYDVALLEIVLQERKLIRRYTSNRADELLHNSRQEADACLERIRSHFEILKLYETVFINYRNQNYSRVLIADTVRQAEQLFAELQQGEYSFEAEVTYHLLQFHHAYSSRDFQKAQGHLQELITQYETNDFLINEDQERYISTLNSYLNNCFSLNQLEAFPVVLQKLKATKATTFKNKALIFQNVYYLEVLYRLARQEYQAVIALAPEIEQGLQYYMGSIPKSRELTIRYNVATAFFLSKNYPQALEWINRILNEPKIEERQDIQALARIFEIVLHYELKNHELVEYLIQSARRFLRKQDKGQSAERIIAARLRQALYSDQRREQKVFAQLAAELQDVKGLEEIKIWVQEKTNVPLPEGSGTL